MNLGAYWSGTRHPLSCVLFVLPLLAIYEVGLYVVNHPAPDNLRNGADVWLRAALAALRVGPVYAAPCLLAGVLLAWCLLRQRDRPLDQGGVVCGMAVESAVFALLLFGLCLLLGQLLVRVDRYLTAVGPEAPTATALTMASAAPRGVEPTAVQILGYLGAGIYEETLFRLLLFSALLALFALGDFPRGASLVLAAAGSALVFASAHHLGPGAEPFNGYVYTFRTVAGLYFAWLYQVRGFGVAVGAHAGYDVGLLLRHV